MTVIVNGTPIGVTLYPPKGSKKTWYVFWAGLTYAKTTGQKVLKEAVIAAEDMVRNNGSRTTLESNILTDEEFEEIQRAHYAKEKDPKEAKRAENTLRTCLEAMSAFKKISGLR